MFKRIFSVMLLAVSLFLGSQVVDVQKAEAQDAWVYSEGNMQYYVVEESIDVNQKYLTMTMQLKHVRNGNLIKTENLKFEYSDGFWWYAHESLNYPQTPRYVEPACRYGCKYKKLPFRG